MGRKEFLKFDDVVTDKRDSFFQKWNPFRQCKD